MTINCFHPLIIGAPSSAVNEMIRENYRTLSFHPLIIGAPSSAPGSQSAFLKELLGVLFVDLPPPTLDEGVKSNTLIRESLISGGFARARIEQW